MGTRNLLIAWALGFCALTVVAMLAWVAAVGPTGKALPSALAGMLASPALAADAVWFIVAYFGLHAALAAAWSGLIDPLVAHAADPRTRRRLAVLSFLPLLLGILLANRRQYPDSTFAADLAPAAAFVADLLLWAIAAYLLLITAAGVGVLLRTRRGRWAAGGALALAVALVIWDAGLPARSGASQPRAQPDVILMGVDGLRPDHVDPVLTPALHALVSDAVRFDNAWTPLARTFPAWVSVLTGQPPGVHGAWFNLVPRAQVDDSGSIAHQLGAAGYHRVYAIDETRFSNIDRSFGFDALVGPATGAFDFVLSAVGDLPLVNLVANTRAGHLLFPYSHSNRALAVSYRPETFDRALARAVSRADRHRPLFLVAHFELPHWPFTWAESDRYEVTVPEHLRALAPRRYHASVARADAQVGALVAALARAGRLDNAAVVLLSDHGEAFPGHEPAWIPAGGAGPLEVHSGHGTHVLGVSQYRVLLALRGYGDAARLPVGIDAGVTASLVDVRPTLHDWLGFAAPDGVALAGASLLTARGTRAVTLETGFSPPSVEAGAPDVAALVEESARYYDVGRGGRLALRADLLPELLAKKQHAAVAGEWILAALPSDDGTRGLVLADHARMLFWDVRNDPLPGGAPIALLFETLCALTARPDDCR